MQKLSQSQGQRRVARVYDIKNCGPRNRFVANGVLVHNSGGDKMNYQNMGRGSKLRDAIQAPDGDVIIVGDSSNIESRVLDWLAGQTDAVEVYRKADAKIGPDVYCVMAEKIYNRSINKTDNPDERQLGKVAKLGLGYGMGYQKFIPTVRVMAKRKLSEAESQMVVQAYRSGHPMVLTLWKRAGEALKAIINGRIGVAVDYRGVIRTCEGGLLLPNGMTIRYPELQVDANGEFSYFNGRTREKVYGGKVVENIIQALSRIIVMYQTLDIHKYNPVKLSVHDEAVALSAEDDAKDALAGMLEDMRKPPEWAPDLPLNSEGGYHKRYGKAKK